MDEEVLTKLKREFPEIEEGVLLEALRNNDYDYRRAAESVRARFYNEEAGIPQEQSFWSSLAAPFGSTEAGAAGGSTAGAWDLSLEGLQEGVTSIGAQLLMGVEAVADTLGSLGDLIPDLIFGGDEEYEEYEDGQPGGPRDRSKVVVGGSRGGAAVKKRGGASAVKAEPPAPRSEPEYATDEETDDWTKED